MKTKTKLFFTKRVMTRKNGHISDAEEEKTLRPHGIYPSRNPSIAQKGRQQTAVGPASGRCAIQPNTPKHVNGSGEMVSQDRKPLSQRRFLFVALELEEQLGITADQVGHRGYRVRYGNTPGSIHKIRVRQHVVGTAVPAQNQ